MCNSIHVSIRDLKEEDYLELNGIYFNVLRGINELLTVANVFNYYRQSQIQLARDYFNRRQKDLRVYNGNLSLQSLEESTKILDALVNLISCFSSNYIYRQMNVFIASQIRLRNFTNLIFDLENC